MSFESPKVCGINHVTFAVGDLDASLEFYRDVLGFRVAARWRHGAYLTVSGVWLVLMRTADRGGAGEGGQLRISFRVEENEFGSLAQRVIDSGAAVWNHKTQNQGSLRFSDPDGHRLEIHTADAPPPLVKRRPPTGAFEFVE